MKKVFIYFLLIIIAIYALFFIYVKIMDNQKPAITGNNKPNIILIPGNDFVYSAAKNILYQPLTFTAINLKMKYA